MRKPFVTLKNWAVVPIAGSLSFEPLQPGRRLVGNAFGHANFPGRAFVWTSSILTVDRRKGLVETSHSVYRLGEPLKAYAAWQFESEHQSAA
jgi:hypothetical protein